jgi:uncharacterized protein
MYFPLFSGRLTSRQGVWLQLPAFLTKRDCCSLSKASRHLLNAVIAECDCVFSTVQGVGSMKCPVCEANLQMTERSGVEIDYCPACRGVWLDRGELDKIIERSSHDSGGRRLSEDRELHFDSDESSSSQRTSQPKKRESFWSELFDFG